MKSKLPYSLKLSLLFVQRKELYSHGYIELVECNRIFLSDIHAKYTRG